MDGATAGQPAGGELVKSAERTLRLLEHLAGSGRRQSLAELSAALDIPKSSLHGLLRTLVACGWGETDSTGTKFSLGIRALLAGSAYLAADDVVSVSQEILDDLSGAVGETIHLGMLDGRDIVYVAKRDAPHPLRLVSAVGVRLAAHSTALGKAVLAQLPAAELAARVTYPLAARTEHTITTREPFEAELAKVRADGFAEDRQESTLGLHCFAVPLVLDGQPPRYALSCSVPLVRLTDDRRHDVVDQLLGARERLAALIGIAKGR
jgi:DNA-binding IclR family transcriptional regulator